MSFSRLVRFVPVSNANSILIGEPVDPNVDVGTATRKGEDVEVRVFSGTSALKPGSLTEKIEKIAKVLSPLAQEEVGTIRCIGLNVRRESYGPCLLLADTLYSTSNMPKRSIWRLLQSPFCFCPY